MKQKITVLTVATLFLGMILYGQAREASVMIDNANRHAVMIAIDQSEKISGEALQQRMARSGLKERPKDGVSSYKGVTMSEISPDKVDIYTKVEAGPNNSSVVYMAVSRGYNNFTNGGTDSVITENVKTFLLSFVQDANYHFADVGITGQASDIAKGEKDYQRLLDEQRSLQKKKAEIDNKLVDIQSRISVMSDSLGRKRTGLEESKTRRANMPNQ